ncbi:ABC transporter ATP-binding protein [Rhodococcus sp. BP-252]|uniref:Nitrate/sulfonate/bicarbonate ABC transporter ATP-binding protein n=1 Tax=Rhodococcoides kyotonense TaxID=398843 RepID=A0A177YJC0_9NOCA|nr:MULTISPECIES: ABC transporter ATP-binding protein [Rhodococcus]MBY6410658.1 ABC transporter ATP-binding protein [Rhodococcus sp. BP-320]MBY6415517.1 ABC transporter ATP-binding protein [Rhodococcus sp. BP-321]MBY6420132.1 ABC transporter ATP-binding protein [Rhodococcus sp. BP-324]MBY6425214.1 ABC transporter ATP-binding protein [Rhodococcus sp. BP-323]MBY6430723.1 ABC transporter ATP-binding protein [Rhodococcus sp. BP-322]
MASIEIKELVKDFHDRQGNSTRVIDGIDLTISGETFVSVVGPSGSGKTTLLNIVSGIETHTSGSVDLRSGGRDARVGYVFQDPRLLPWRTVMANLGFVQHEREGWEDRARHYLDLVGLSHCADRYPSQLSGGQQQRIGIARAFAVEPDVLLMDEPFSHLDAMTSRTLREHLERIWLESRRTVMFVTHDVTEAVQLSDRIIVLAPGGRIHEIIDVDLPRPRKASDPAVAVLQAEVLARFEALERGQVEAV